MVFVLRDERQENDPGERRSRRRDADRAPAGGGEAPQPPVQFPSLCGFHGDVTPLSRHDGDAPAERAQVARGAAVRTVVDRFDVLDEVADDGAGVVARDRVVAVALARIVKAVALAGPAGDVEEGEVLDRVALVAGALKGAVRHDEHRDDPGVAGVVVGPVVGRGAGGGLLAAENAVVHARRDLAGGLTGLGPDAIPAECGRLGRALAVIGARLAAVAGIPRGAAGGDLVLERRAARIAVDGLRLAAAGGAQDRPGGGRP